MGTIPPGEVTRLLKAVEAGKSAEQELFGLIYNELKESASRLMKAWPADQTLQPTALVHEVYLRLKLDDLAVKNRKYLFGAQARAMHQVLVDHARKRAGKKYGGGWQRMPLEAVKNRLETSFSARMEDLDPALKELSASRPQKYQIFILQFWGFSDSEVAEKLGISAAKDVADDFAFAHAWLSDKLRKKKRPPRKK